MSFSFLHPSACLSYTTQNMEGLQNMQNHDMNLVLSTDAKPRLKWTPELHQRFVDAVNQLGEPDKATPKNLMRVIGISGLTLYHLKSHLQLISLHYTTIPSSQTNQGLTVFSSCKNTGWQKANRQKSALAIN
ncbi:myb-related protein 2-like [Hibiscus syriacus]|uniref:myb-related protein 2-like n=1 Tax=Hibiscus syriacus TaxID=106335 RepID=UPI001920A28A|nr:myb-related protein 2-like [Hibiscus syriacus]